MLHSLFIAMNHICEVVRSSWNLKRFKSILSGELYTPVMFLKKEADACFKTIK